VKRNYILKKGNYKYMDIEREGQIIAIGPKRSLKNLMKYIVVDRHGIELTDIARNVFYRKDKTYTIRKVK